MREVSFLVFLMMFSGCVCNFSFQECGKYDLNNNGTFKSSKIKTYTQYYQNATKIILPKHTQYSHKNNKKKSDIFTIWKAFPIDLFNNSQTISKRCHQAYEHYLMKVLDSNLEALKMFDASAKLPSGILNGNVNQYGDFDECMEVRNAQYCLAEIDLAPVWKKPLSDYKDLVHSHFSIKETFNDPGHRIPGFTFVRWGFCIPKGCSNTDLTNVLKEKLGVESRIRPSLCQPSEKQTNKLTLGDYIARSYFVFVIIFVAISTISHGKINQKTNNKWIQIFMGFSLQKNYKQLIKISQNKNEIKSVHGVRGLSAMALIISHKTMALLYNPFINRTSMAEAQSMKWSVIGRTAIIYTDCFLLISGLLNANAMFSDLDKNCSKIKFKEKFVNRLFRILPSLITVILFCTYLLPLLGSGPLYPLVVNYHSELCKKYMWRNIFLIHNYYGFENMCLTHTHQVGMDMQLFLATPIFVYLIWKFKSKGFWTVGLLACGSTILRFWATLKYNLSHVIHFGVPISRMFDTANYSYILPTHRATIYLLGVVLAYVLKYTSNVVPFSKVQSIFIWTLLYIVSISTWLGPVNMSVKGYEYNSMPAAIYGALSPISWGLGVAWVIYTTERGVGSWFQRLLNLKYFEIFTKIAYAVYLVQFPVFFYNVGITRHADQFKSYMMFPPVEVGIILIFSTILTLFVEMPFQNINNVLFKSVRCK